MNDTTAATPAPRSLGMRVLTVDWLTGRDGATYLMDHSAFTYLMGPDWTVLDILPPQLSPQDMAQRIGRQL